MRKTYRNKVVLCHHRETPNTTADVASKIEPKHDKTNKMTQTPSNDSDQNIRCPHEEVLGPCLSLERTLKALIRPGGCPGRSESSLGAQIISLVLSCAGSNIMENEDAQEVSV